MNNYPFLPNCIETETEKFALGVARTAFPSLAIRDVEPICKTISDKDSEIILPNAIFVGNVSLHISAQGAVDLVFNFIQNDGLFSFSRVSPADGMFYESSVFPLTCHGSFVTAGVDNVSFFSLTFNGFALYTDKTLYVIP